MPISTGGGRVLEIDKSTVPLSISHVGQGWWSWVFGGQPMLFSSVVYSKSSARLVLLVRAHITPALANE
jgi:hypothetical protein